MRILQLKFDLPIYFNEEKILLRKLFGLPVRDKCCQVKNTDQAKELRVNKTLQELRKSSLENITTEYGIYLRQ